MKNIIIIVIVLIVVFSAIFLLKDRSNTVKNNTILIHQENNHNTKQNIDSISNDVFRVFRESNCKDREKSMESVIKLLNEKYIGKCSEKDIVKWLGNNFEKNARFNRPNSNVNNDNSIKVSIRIPDISYLAKEERNEAQIYQTSLVLGFSNDGFLDFVGSSLSVSK